jgi:hypothetical protein
VKTGPSCSTLASRPNTRNCPIPGSSALKVSTLSDSVLRSTLAGVRRPPNSSNTRGSQSSVDSWASNGLDNQSSLCLPKLVALTLLLFIQEREQGKSGGTPEQEPANDSWPVSSATSGGPLLSVNEVAEEGGDEEEQPPLEALEA